MIVHVVETCLTKIKEILGKIREEEKDNSCSTAEVISEAVEKPKCSWGGDEAKTLQHTRR